MPWNVAERILHQLVTIITTNCDNLLTNVVKTPASSLDYCRARKLPQILNQQNWGLRFFGILTFDWCDKILTVIRYYILTHTMSFVTF